MNLNVEEKPIPQCDTINHVIHYAVLHLSLKKGLREFGAKGKEAAMKEMQQHHDMSTFKPVHAKDLSRDEKHKALRSLIFLKQKPNGDVKGGSCAEGRPQQETLTSCFYYRMHRCI